jgi:hypothetical protein
MKKRKIIEVLLVGMSASFAFSALLGYCFNITIGPMDQSIIAGSLMIASIFMKEKK